MPAIFQFIDRIEADKQEAVAQRLETRAQMPQFVAIREAYLDRIGLPPGGSVHELGCGTGAVCRAIAAWPGFTGRVSGSDLSASLIEEARKLTADAGLAKVDFLQADGQGIDTRAGQYDMVLADTVVSHFANPAAFVAEAIRPAKPGGRIVIHDGDYASMTFDSSLPELDRTLPGRYFEAIVANPYVMRELPSLLRAQGRGCCARKVSRSPVRSATWCSRSARTPISPASPGTTARSPRARER